MAKGHKIDYSIEELAWLSNNRTLPISEYTELFNRFFGRDVSKRNLHALRNRNGWKTGRNGQFKPGNVPHPDAGAKGPNKTSFRKGQVPANAKLLYYERVSKDGYIEIKVPERNPHTGHKTRFRLKHQWVWEQAGRTVPEGHMLHFIDGDRTNCALENLELMHRGVNAILNKSGYSSLPSELKPTTKAIAKVQHKAYERKQKIA